MKAFNRDFTTALQHIKGVTSGEKNLVANLANIAAILKTLEGYFWVGFYLVEGKELVLGPFQGPVACTRIGHGRGVCGTSWAEKRSILVPDVHLFPGHIACSALSQSEVVVPVLNRNGDVHMVIDVDSDLPAAFDSGDVKFLEAVAAHILTLQYEKV